MDLLGDSEFSRSSAAFIVTVASRPVNRGDCAAPRSISVKPPLSLFVSRDHLCTYQTPARIQTTIQTASSDPPVHVVRRQRPRRLNKRQGSKGLKEGEKREGGEKKCWQTDRRLSEKCCSASARLSPSDPLGRLCLSLFFFFLFHLALVFAFLAIFVNSHEGRLLSIEFKLKTQGGGQPSLDNKALLSHDCGPAFSLKPRAF